jgi:NAD(P)-dependent dehydrogenase (short-subunit alcohol dehydrogenase family)
VEALAMDHDKMSTVIAAAKTFMRKEKQLHGLVNNAGIMATPFALTEDGYEAQFQTNYMAHWVFTHHLLPILKATAENAPAGSVRIVNLSSAGEQLAPSTGINFDDTALPKDSSLARYGQSKLANILHAKTLHQRHGSHGIWTASVHPGLVGSNLADKASELPMWMYALGFAARIVGALWPPDKGAWTSVFCAASPEMKADQSGCHFVRIAKLGSESARAKDMQLAEKLEEWTTKEMETKGFL